MTQAVTFDYATWVARYPEFTQVNAVQAQAYFDEAGLYFTNDICNPAFSTGTMPTLLNMLTAHIAFLNAPRNALGNPSAAGQPASPLVGRISQATEGSVNVSIELDSSGSPSEAWYTQTKYGFAFWQATAQYRTMHYSARPTYVPGTAYPLWGRRW